MKAIRTLFIAIVSIALSGSCNDDDNLTLIETVNLGTEVAFTDNIGCSKGALTYVTPNKLIIGVEQPKFIDLNTKAVADITFDSDAQLGYYQVKATEIHLVNISYEVIAFTGVRNLRMTRLSVATGTETSLVDNLAPFYFNYLSLLGPAMNETDILFNKEGNDSTIYQKKLYDNTPQTTLPVKGIPFFFNQSGNLLLYATRKGFYQYDAAQQSPALFLSPFAIGSDYAVSAIFLIKDKPFIIYGHYAINNPVYIRDLSTTDGILISDTGSNGGIQSGKISPDEQYLCFWAYHQVYDEKDYYDVYELSVFDFEAQEIELVFRMEQHGSGVFSCYGGSPDFSANFSPDSKMLTYIFHGKVYQHSLGN